MRSFLVQRRFKPGDRAQQSGVYDVQHHRHRPTHQVLVLAGMAFPSCRQCGERVRFQLAAAAHNWDTYAEPRPPALLVVDTSAVTDELKPALERDGYAVSTASSYTTAVGMLHRDPYDAVITELDLEAETIGLELARTAQASRSAPLVIVSTADASERKLRALLGSRINYLVTKPIDLVELRSALARLMMRRAALIGAPAPLESRG